MVKSKDKKTLYITLIVIILLIITIGVSYAIWMITKEQTGGATVLGQIV